MFRLSPATDEADEKYDVILKLRSGGTLRYKLDRDIGGGMGGTEGELKGRLEIGARVIVMPDIAQGVDSASDAAGDAGARATRG